MIFNEVNKSGVWPSKWKTEHLTVIPKNPNPSDLSECRNISCTSIFSKVLEGEVQAQLRRELIPDPNQYGGIPKSSVEHMLVNLWEKILEALEGGSNAAILLGVDYEKAFNRMRHDVCLGQLKKLGASKGSIWLVRAFLEGRSMTICINKHRPTPVPITRCSPQGSVLGCLLYSVTTQLLTQGLREGNVPPVIPRPGAVTNMDQLASFLYVDNTTLFDCVPLGDATRHCTTSATVETFRSLALEQDFVNLSDNAEGIGMRINAKKHSCS